MAPLCVNPSSSHWHNLTGSRGNDSLSCVNTRTLLIALPRPLCILHHHTFTYQYTDILPLQLARGERLKQVINKQIKFLKEVTPGAPVSTAASVQSATCKQLHAVYSSPSQRVFKH